MDSKQVENKNQYYFFEFEYSKLFKSQNYISDLYVLKQIIFKIANEIYQKYKKNLSKEKLYVSRYKPINFPTTFSLNNSTKLIDIEGPFQYDYNANSLIFEWYLNFADPILFVAYKSGLFAQDEIQVAEHPILMFLKEELVSVYKNQNNDSNYAPNTQQYQECTPILIRNVQRLVHVKTDRNSNEGRPYGLYGNEFQQATQEMVSNAVVKLDPPSRTNLICMAALSYKTGEYTYEQIYILLQTAFTAFKGAMLEAEAHYYQQNIKQKQYKVVIHTGNWGSGAFGNNKELIALLQILAANLAGVDELIYHTYDADGTENYKAAFKIYQEMFTKSQLNIHGVIKQIKQMKYVWGTSDGN